jgi:hypothetical protein
MFTDNIRSNFFSPKIHQLQLKPGVETWYNKLQLFNLDYQLPGDQTFFFDLDTIIVANIDNILSYEGNFIALQDFYRKDGLGSGLMSWKTLKHKYIWDYYETNKKIHRLGDQGIVEDATRKEVDRWQNVYPGEIVSYKVHCKKRGLPRRAKIVCFHGIPNPHEIKESWARENWK